MKDREEIELAAADWAQQLIGCNLNGGLLSHQSTPNSRINLSAVQAMKFV